MTSGQVTPAETSEAAIQPLFANALCAIDGKEGGYAAVEQAASVVGSEGRVTLLAVTSFRSAGTIRGPALSPARVTEILGRAGQIARDAHVPYTEEVEPATPPAEVVSAWGARYDLLALGAPASSWLAGLFTAGVGDTALDVLPTPLLIARAAPGDRPFGERIVVASDGLDASNALVGLGAALANALGARLTLVHASGFAPHLHRHLAEQEQTLEEQRGMLAAALPAERVEIVMTRGHAHEAIASTADAAGASLTVLGSRRLDGLRAVGSVGRRVAHEARCSVLLVPPESLLAQ